MFDGPLAQAQDDAKFRMVASGGFLLVDVRRSFDAEHMLAIHEQQAQLVATVGKHAVMVIVGEVRAEMSERARELAKRSSATFREHVACVAHVVEVRGFIGAAIRCVMAGMRALNRPPYPIREFATVGVAARWMLPQMQADAVEMPLGFDADAIDLWIAQSRAPGSPL